jgi:hypothetical protein
MRIGVSLVAQTATVPAAHFQIAGRTRCFAHQVHSALVTGQAWKAAERYCHPGLPQTFNADPGRKTRTVRTGLRGQKTITEPGEHATDPADINVQDNVSARGLFSAGRK